MARLGERGGEPLQCGFVGVLVSEGDEDTDPLTAHRLSDVAGQCREPAVADRSLHGVQQLPSTGVHLDAGGPGQPTPADDDPEQPSLLQHHTQPACPKRHVPGGRGVGDDAPQEVAARLSFDGGGVLYDELVQRDGGRGALQQDPCPCRRLLVAQQHEPPPPAAPGLDAGHQPARARLVTGAGRDLDRA